MKHLKLTTLSVLCIFALHSQAQIINNDFDENPGANTYFSLSSGNWHTGSGLGISPNAGATALLSANGNTTGTFSAIGLEKDLGATIEMRTYKVAMYVSKYNALAGIELSDFSELIIGGAAGVMSWDSTPVPTQDSIWLKWEGTYTPAAADSGTSFIFRAIFDLDALHAIALDGPITVDTIVTTTPPSSIEAKVNLPKVRVYPNPFTDQITIEGAAPNTVLQVMDVLGNELSVIRNTNTIDASLWPAGIYFLKVNDETRKLVKQH